jgi:hypothetical protein
MGADWKEAVVKAAVEFERNQAMRKLGEVQQGVLRSLREFGYWIPEHSGWVWDNTSGTQRVLESLVKRGLVTKQEVLEHPKFEHKFRKPKFCYLPVKEE